MDLRDNPVEKISLFPLFRNFIQIIACSGDIEFMVSYDRESPSSRHVN
jgi:hypothetical protein